MDALDNYASDNLFDDKTDPILVNKLGSKIVHGDGMIPFKEPIDGSNSYEVAFMCKGEESRHTGSAAQPIVYSTNPFSSSCS